MFAMLARAIQYLLALVGLLFVGVALVDIRTKAAAAAAGSGFFPSLEAHLKVPLFLFLGFMAFVGAHRISRLRKNSGRHTFSDHKG